MLLQTYLETNFNFYLSDLSFLTSTYHFRKDNIYGYLKTFWESDIITFNDKPRYRWIRFWGQEKKYPYYYGPRFNWETFWNYYRCFVYWDPIPFDLNSWLCYRFTLEKTPTNNINFLRGMDYTTAYLFIGIDIAIALACFNYFLLAWDPELKYWLGHEGFYNYYFPMIEPFAVCTYDFCTYEPSIQLFRILTFNVAV